MSAVLDNAKNFALAGAFSLGTIFGVQAQSPANGNNVLAMNDKPKTEASANANAKAPVIIRSSSWEAQNYSIDNNALVVHIAIGNKEKMYTAEEYATMLSAMFLDPDRTENPTQVVFFIEERNADFSAKCRTYINGYRFDKNGGQLKDGDDFIHPYDLPGFIPVITKKYAAAKSSTPPVSVGYTND